MTRKFLSKSLETKSEKRRPAYRYQPVKGEKTKEGKPLQDSPQGRGFVEFHGKRHYIDAPYQSGEGWCKYWDLIRQWESKSLQMPMGVCYSRSRLKMAERDRVGTKREAD